MLRLLGERVRASTAHSPVNSGKERKKGKKIVPIVSIVFKTSASKRRRARKQGAMEGSRMLRLVGWLLGWPLLGQAAWLLLGVGAAWKF